MSHVALRRVVIRLLHDPDLVRALETDPARALAGVELTAAERHALATTPPAAWRTDPERPARLRAALAEEFPGATALAPTRADRFFASACFHRAIQERGSVALAFGAYLADDPDPRVADVARLETAVARVRRAPRRPTASRDAHVRLAPHAAVVRTARGASAALAAVRMGARPRASEPGVESVLVLRDPASDAVTLEKLSTELAALLESAATEAPCERLRDVAIGLGADDAEAAATIDRLRAEGVLL